MAAGAEPPTRGRVNLPMGESISVMADQCGDAEPALRYRICVLWWGRIPTFGGDIIGA
jgi:hypothetical protein